MFDRAVYCSISSEDSSVTESLEEDSMSERTLETSLTTAPELCGVADVVAVGWPVFIIPSAD